MPEERVRRRLAAILAADVVGYSRLMGLDEAGTLARLKSLRAELLEPSVEKYGGRIVKTTGDGTLIEFGSAVDAVAHAVEVQRGMAERNAGLPDDERIALRMGINVGDVITDADDIYGDGVNVAARLETLAEPGGICISAGVHDYVTGRLDVDCEDLGDQSLKNIAQPVRVYRIRLDRRSEPPTRLADGAGPRSEQPSIAVLPFDNMSGDPEQEFFADGITEDIITAISGIRQFFVIARNSTFTYKGRSVNVQTVADELGVRYVLEGSVRKAANRVRITAQLIDGETGKHLWAERYDRDLEDIFAVQDEITQTVVGTLEPELARAEFKRVETRPPESLDAWGLYHQAMAHYGRWNREENLRARHLFEEAIARDPGFARAHAGLSWTFTQDALLGLTERDLRRALDSAKTAVTLDDRDSFAHLALGRAYHHSKMREEARNELELAVSLNPSSAHAQSLLGLCLQYMGHAEDAKSHMELSIRLSPHDPEIGVFMTRLAHVNLSMSRFDEAVEIARKAIQRVNIWPPHAFLTAAYGHLGQIAQAEEARKELQRVSPGISMASVANHLPADPATLDHLLAGLRKAGLPEE